MLTQIITPAHRKHPLMLEVPVSEGLDGPFLVSSTRGLLWVREAFASWNLRAAVREIPRLFMFREAVEAVAAKSEELEWGSVFDATEAGLQGSVEYLRGYGFEAVKVLYDPYWKLAADPPSLSEEVSWLPKGWAVVIPEDPSYLGSLIEFGDVRCALVLHNPSRGIAFLTPHDD